VSTFRISPTTSLRIADLNDKTKEDLAKKYDVGNKGYLTTNEAYKLYAEANGDAQPRSLTDVINFLGGAQHPMTSCRAWRPRASSTSARRARSRSTSSRTSPRRSSTTA
jgi:hypothetical protein